MSNNTISPNQRKLCLLASIVCCIPMMLQLPAPLMTALALSMCLAFFYQKQLPGALRILLVALLGATVLTSYNFGIGRDAASAALLAMLALKPFETHSPRDAKSLLGFSLFAPFAAFLQDQGPLTLGLSLPAFLLCLMAFAELAQMTSMPWRNSMKAAGNAALIALPLALVGFWLFPRLSTPLWGLPQNAIGGKGLGDRMEPGEWLDKLADDRIVIRAKFISRTPDRSQMYWRGPVLVHFDGSAWTRDQGAKVRRRPVVAPDLNSVRYEVMLEPTATTDLIVLDLPTKVPDNSRLSNEFTAMVSEPVESVQRYEGESTLLPVFVEPLDNVSRLLALRLPTDLNPRTRELAETWFNENPDPIALANRFQTWIRKDFIYTLDAPLLGRDSADDFLFNTKRGFCQHYSSSFAVFMRSAGVPTRVVTGYVGGRRNKFGNYWMLYGKDAHAWNEIWVEGRGWVRIDPTAAVAPENILDTVDDLQGTETFADSVFSSTFETSDWLRRSWNELVLGYNSARQKNLLKPLGLNTEDNRQLTIVFMIGVCLALALTLMLLLRQRREDLHEVERAWRTFIKKMRKQRHAKLPHEPASLFVERVAKLYQSKTPESAERIRYLGARYT
ncbi:MAG: transglutaminaseTgpA domain-containing protein, partial [Arenimonas sp.]